MMSAHGPADGPNFEALVLAVPLVALGIILFVQKSAKPVVSVVLVVAGVALGYGGFTFLGGDDQHDDAEAGPESAYAPAVQGLCDARSELEDDDPAAARAAFFDRSHDALHEIADRLAGEDRAAAGDLLEAKQAVEEGFRGDETSEGSREPASLESVQADVDMLIIATVRGLAELDEPVRGCA